MTSESLQQVLLSALARFPYGATSAQIEALTYAGRDETEEILSELVQTEQARFDGRLYYPVEMKI